jgi:hypothetical protein
VANERYAHLTDEQLKARFSIVARRILVPETLQDMRMLIDELKARGYVLDALEFLTCEEWNQRHTGKPPMDCSE